MSVNQAAELYYHSDRLTLRLSQNIFSKSAAENNKTGPGYPEAVPIEPC